MFYWFHFPRSLQFEEKYPILEQGLFFLFFIFFTTHSSFVFFMYSRVVGSGEKQKMTAAVGTPNFIAPEVLGEGSETVYSLSSDVFSYAIV